MESSIFEGCTFYIERREGDDNKRQMLHLVDVINSHGGRTNPDPTSEKVTHILIFADDHDGPNMQVDLDELLKRSIGRSRVNIEKDNSWTQNDLLLRYARRVGRDEVQSRDKRERQMEVIRQEWIAECIELGGTSLGPHFGGWEVRVSKEPEPVVPPPGALHLFNRPKPDSDYTPPERSPRPVYKPIPIPWNPYGISRSRLLDPIRQIATPNAPFASQIKPMKVPTYDPSSDPRRNLLTRQAESFASQSSTSAAAPVETSSVTMTAASASPPSPQELGFSDAVVLGGPAMQTAHCGQSPKQALNMGRENTPPITVATSHTTPDDRLSSRSPLSSVPSNPSSPVITSPAISSPLVTSPAVGISTVASSSASVPLSTRSLPSMADNVFPPMGSSSMPVHCTPSPSGPSSVMSPALMPASAATPRAGTDAPRPRAMLVQAAIKLRGPDPKGQAAANPPAHSSHCSRKARKPARLTKAEVSIQDLMEATIAYASALRWPSVSMEDFGQSLPRSGMLGVSPSHPQQAKAVAEALSTIDVRVPLVPSTAHNVPEKIKPTAAKFSFTPSSSYAPIDSASQPAGTTIIPTTIPDSTFPTCIDQTAEVYTGAHTEPASSTTPADVPFKDQLGCDTPDTNLSGADLTVREPSFDGTEVYSASPCQLGDDYVSDTEIPAAATTDTPVKQPHICIGDKYESLAVLQDDLSVIDPSTKEKQHDVISVTASPERGQSGSQHPQATSSSSTAIMIDSDSDDDFEILETPVSVSRRTTPHIAMSQRQRRYPSPPSSNSKSEAAVPASYYTYPRCTTPSVDPRTLAPTQPERMSRTTSRRLTRTLPNETDHLEEEIIADPRTRRTNRKRKVPAVPQLEESSRSLRRSRTCESARRRKITAQHRTVKKRKVVFEQAVSHLPSPTNSPASQSMSRLEDMTPSIIVAEEPVNAPADPGGIFVNPSGIPVNFHVISLALRQLAELLLPPNGGLLTDLNHAHIVVLDALPGAIDVNALNRIANGALLVNKVLISSTYIADCIKKKEMLHCGPYRVEVLL